MKTMHNKPSQIQAILLVALSGTLYGFMGFFGTKILQENLSVATMLFWRFFIAGLWMLAYGCIKHENFFASLTESRIFTLPFLLGALCYSGSSGFYFLASKHTGTGLAMVLFFCYPVFVAAFAWAQNNWRINKYSLAALLAIVMGLILLKGSDDNPISIMGIILGVASAFSYAIYVFKSKKMLIGTHTAHFTMIICFNCALVFLIIALVTNSFSFPTSSHAWIHIIALSILATAIPIQLLLEGLKTISPLKVSILSVLEPVVTLFVGIALLSEPISTLQIIGVLILLSGAIIIQFLRE